MNQAFTSTISPSAMLFADMFTFSAKERDSETGLSYFGSRYYSSDLSIWLSVDPMAAKYASTSPYAYCRNNPIIMVDPNGEFDTRAEARRYRKEHHTGGIIKRNSGRDKFSGKFSIDNKREYVSYTKPQYVEDDASIPMIGQSSDGVVKSPIILDPRTRREKLDDFDRKAAQKGVAIGQGMATALPITSQINDIMILSKGENMFGDKATESDKVWATIDLATLGVGKTFKLFEEAGGPVVRKAADIIEDVGNGLNIRSWFVTTKNKWKNGKKRK
jgi:RHS repeat-associated protein